MEELEFIKLLRDGDRVAFKVLLDNYGKKVFNTVLSFVRSNEDAEDVTQEVFTEIYQSVAGFQGKSSLSTWIYRISVNKSLEFIRKKQRKKRFALFVDFFGEKGEQRLPEPVHFDHPGVQIQKKEQAAILFAAIDRLPENQKTAFLLSKVEGLSYKDIAGIMNITISSVESLLFRAKRNLQELLKDYYEKNLK